MAFTTINLIAESSNQIDRESFSEEIHSLENLNVADSPVEQDVTGVFW